MGHQEPVRFDLPGNSAHQDASLCIDEVSGGIQAIQFGFRT
jgi:hypothetical protein